MGLVSAARPSRKYSTGVHWWAVLSIIVIPACCASPASRCSQTTEYLTHNTQPPTLTRYIPNFAGLTKSALDALTGIVIPPACNDGFFVADSPADCEALGSPLVWSDFWQDNTRQILDRNFGSARLLVEDVIVVGNRSNPDTFKLYDTRLQAAGLAVGRLGKTLEKLNSSYRLDSAGLFRPRPFSPLVGYALRLHLVKTGVTFSFAEEEYDSQVVCQCGPQGFLHNLATLAGTAVCDAFDKLQKLTDLTKDVWTAAREITLTTNPQLVGIYQKLVAPNMLLWTGLSRQPPIQVLFSSKTNNMSQSLKTNLESFADLLALLPTNCSVFKTSVLSTRVSRSIFDWLSGADSTAALRDNQNLAFSDLKIFHSNQRKLLSQLKAYRLFSKSITRTENKLHQATDSVALEIGKVEVGDELDNRRQARAELHGRLSVLQLVNWNLCQVTAAQLTEEIDSVVSRLGGLVERCRLTEMQSGGAAVGCESGGASVTIAPPGDLVVNYHESHNQLLAVKLFRCLVVPDPSNRSAILRNRLHGNYVLPGNATHYYVHGSDQTPIPKNCLTASPPDKCYINVTDRHDCYFIFSDKVTANCLNNTMIVTAKRRSQLVGVEAAIFSYDDFPLQVGTERIDLGYALDRDHYSLPAVTAFKQHTAAQSQPSPGHIQGTFNWKPAPAPPRPPRLHGPATGQYTPVKLPWYAVLISSLGSVTAVVLLCCCCGCLIKYGWCQLCCPSGAECSACCSWAFAWWQPQHNTAGDSHAGPPDQSRPLLPPAAPPAAQSRPPPSPNINIPGDRATHRRAQSQALVLVEARERAEDRALLASMPPANLPPGASHVVVGQSLAGLPPVQPPPGHSEELESLSDAGERLKLRLAQSPHSQDLVVPCQELLDAVHSREALQVSAPVVLPQ